MTDKKHTFLWLLTQGENRGYDTFDSIVVAADTEEDAKQLLPNSYATWGSRRWADSPDGVYAEKIGVTQSHRKGDVIIASFNAG